MRFIEASEPTDIIWENRHHTRFDYIKRQIFAYIVVGILLFGSFVLIYVITEYQTNVGSVFPTDINCATIDEAYGDNL